MKVGFLYSSTTIETAAGRELSALHVTVKKPFFPPRGMVISNGALPFLSVQTVSVATHFPSVSLMARRSVRCATGRMSFSSALLCATTFPFTVSPGLYAALSVKTVSTARLSFVFCV